VVVDLAAELGPDLFFRLDDHITAEGHRHLAQRLWQIIQEEESKVQVPKLKVES